MLKTSEHTWGGVRASSASVLLALDRLELLWCLIHLAFCPPSTRVGFDRPAVNPSTATAEVLIWLFCV